MVSVRRLVRAAAHLAAWLPFAISAVASLLESWRVVGDGALVALGSWSTFTQIPLTGMPTEFPGSPHDLGPAEFWLLAVPVHVDPARGVLWGAALLCMIAASLAIEAAWSTAGELGGVAASAVILGMAAWMPGLAFRPYWNPYFGALFFLASLAAGWAVMSGHRRWWPVLVVTGSIAAQAHLMFALASAALILAALVTGLADALRARASSRWAVTGLAAGLACWMAPADQQFTNQPGNITLLLRAQTTGRHPGLGLSFALKTLAAFTQPPPLWSRLHLGQRQHIYRLIDTKPASFAAVILALTAASLVIATITLTSRKLASLAAIALVTSTTAAFTISHVPAGHGDRGRLSYLIITMFPAGVLTWATLTATLILTTRHLATRRPQPRPDRTYRQPTTLTRYATRYARVATIPLLLAAALPGLIQQQGRPPAGHNADQVTAVAALIEHTLPTEHTITITITAPKSSRYQDRTGLLWALTGDGYTIDYTRHSRIHPIPHLTIHIHARTITVQLRQSQGPSTTHDSRTPTRQCAMAIVDRLLTFGMYETWCVRFSVPVFDSSKQAAS